MMHPYADVTGNENTQISFAIFTGERMRIRIESNGSQTEGELNIGDVARLIDKLTRMLVRMTIAQYAQERGVDIEDVR